MERIGGDMMRKVLLIFILFCSFMLVACANNGELETNKNNELETNKVESITTHNPTVEEILSQDPDADILYMDDIVYATNIDWVDELSLTKGEEIGEIEKNTTNPKEFINKTANVLPVGTKIYRAKGSNGMLIADDKYYYGLVEG